MNSRKSHLYRLVLTAGLILVVILGNLLTEQKGMSFMRTKGQVITWKDTCKNQPWTMHLIDPAPPSGSDGVKLFDVNGDGLQDLVTGFEEGGVSRIYINPGVDKSKNHWKYVELPSPDVEDAVLVDLDQDGKIDLVTASEGKTNQIWFHWAPQNSNDYMAPDKWKTISVPAVENKSAWMFVVPMDMDGQHGIDLIVGSKRKRGEKGLDKALVGWLQSPADPRNIDEWKFYPLTTAGWIMSIEVRDMNDDQRPDILISDRKNSTGTGVRWLENPGKFTSEFYEHWTSHMIGADLEEPMFHTSVDLNGDGTYEVVVPDLYNGLAVLQQTNNPYEPWAQHLIPYPNWAGPRGKAVSAGDIDLNGRIDLVLSFEEDGKVASIPYDEYKENGKYSVIWGSYTHNPIGGEWSFQKVSGLKGRKFDLINLIDLDGDGDLDVLTNDENEDNVGLGVVWYENPNL